MGPFRSLVRGLGRVGAGLLVVALALIVPYLGLTLIERVFDITIGGLFKPLILLVAMFFVIVSLEPGSG